MSADNGNNISKFYNQQYQEVEEQGGWLANNLHKLMISVSVIWFAIVIIYITQFFGVENLLVLMPDEFGGFLAGVTLPLAIIWVVMAYIDRGTSFKNEAKFLRAYMNQLVYPEDGGAQTAKAMADAIRSQVIELQEVTKLATVETDKIKDELGARVQDFEKLVGILDKYSTHTIVELADSVKTLIRNFDVITTKAEDSKDNFRDYASEFSQTANNIQRDMRMFLDTVIPSIQEMRSTTGMLQNITDENSTKLDLANDRLLDFSQRASQSMNHVSDVLSDQIDKLDSVSNNAVATCNDIYKTLEGGISKVDQELRSQSQFVIDHVDLLEKRSDELTKTFVGHREEITVEVDKVIARANVINESVSMQVRELSKVADEIDGIMKSTEDSISTAADSLAAKSEAVVGDITAVVNVVEDETVKVEALSGRYISKIEDVHANINEKHSYLLQVFENIFANLKMLNQELNEKSLNIQQQSDDSMDKLHDVTSVMKKSAESLTEASSIVVSQSKISEQALSQQQRHITGSVNKIEEIKTDIKRQIDELSKAALQIDAESQTAVKRLKDQMVEALTVSENVIVKTNAINDNLKDQVSNFDDVTSGALAKAGKFEDALNIHYKKINETYDAIEGKSVKVADVLDKQTKLVDKTSDDTNKLYTNILNSFETQSSLLNSVAERTVGYVSDVVQALDEKADTINVLFKHQENEFMDVCKKLEDNTDSISSNLKKQISSLEQSADRIFAKISNLEQDVTKQSEDVITNTDKSIDKLTSVKEYIGSQNKELDRFIRDMEEKLNIISDGFRNNVNGFNNIVKDVRDEANVAANSLIDNSMKVKDINAALSNEAKHINVMMEDHIRNLDTSVIKVQTQADNIKEIFNDQRDNLTEIVNVVSAQTRLGEASLAQQYKYLSDTAAEVYQKMNNVNDKMKENADNIFDNSGKLAYEFDVLADKLNRVSEEVMKTSKNALKNVEQTNLALNNCSDEFSHMVDNSRQRVAGVITDYEDYIAKFNTVTAEASTGVVEINDLISVQNDKMISLSEGTKEIVEYFNTVLNATSEDLATRANKAYDKVKGLGDSLKALSAQLEDSTKKSATHFEKSGDKLRAAISEIAANAERISNDIRDSGEVFLKQSEALVETTGDTLKKVNDAIGMVGKKSDEFNKKGEDIVQKSISFNDLFNKQIKSWEDTSAKADAKLNELEKIYESIKVDSFLKDAGSIMEKLENFAVDINRIFNPEAEEDIWKKYYNGDTAAFVRHLAKGMTKKQILSIHKEYENNLEFRTIVTKYLSEFETLITKAQNNERASILLSVISGSDIGKLYFVLAKSLDKIS